MENCKYMENSDIVPYVDGVYYASGCKLKDGDKITSSCLLNRKRKTCPSMVES